MADFRKMIPFICHFAAGVFGKDGCELELPERDIFELAKLRGWSDDKDDPGGATMIDVTLKTYSTYKGRRVSKDELRNIRFEEWMEIIKTLFWDRCRCDDYSHQGIANIIFDWVWASGPGAIKRFQKILSVRQDGVIGLKTLAAMNSQDAEILFFKIREERELYYKSCRGAWKYLNGWLRRLYAIQPDGSFLIYGKRVGKG